MEVKFDPSKLPSRSQIEKTISELQIVDLSNVSYEKIYSVLFNLLEHIPIPSVDLAPGAVIDRARIHTKNELFTSEKDISFRTDYSNIKMQRANISGQSMFYGATPTKEVDTPRITLLHECSEVFRKKTPIEEINETIWMTVGKWEVISPIKCVEICFHENAIQKNSRVKEAFKKHSDNLYELTKEKVDDIYTIHKFLSNEFAKEFCPNEDFYKITAAYMNFVLIMGQHMNIQGIVYPSVRTDFKGSNVALLPEVVINGSLELRNVSLIKCFKEDNTINVITDKMAIDLGILNSDFKWYQSVIDTNKEGFANLYPYSGTSF